MCLPMRHTMILPIILRRRILLQAQIARVLGLTDETDEGRYAFMAEYYAKAKYLHFKAELLIRKMLANGIPDFRCARGPDRYALLHG